MSSLRTCQPNPRKSTERKPCLTLPRYLQKMKAEQLRQRMLLQKYGNIYLKKVFRNVRPSEATRHYERQLLRNAFHRWKLLWWQQREEWRLTLRANCYYRFVLLKQSFSSWKEYVRRKHEARRKKEVAERHYERKVMSRSLNCLKQNSELSKNFKRNTSLKLEILEIVIAKQECLHSIDKLISCRVDVLACAVWKNKCITKYWKLWMEYSQLQKVKKSKQACALKMYGSKLQQMVFKSWQEYISLKKAKHKVLKTADQTYKENLLSTYLLAWNERYQHLMWEKQLGDKVKELYNHKVLHSCFRLWSVFAKEKSKERLADEHYTRSMKRRALKSLKQYADYTSKWRLAKKRSILKHAWRLWTDAVELSQLRQMWPQVEMADSFHRKKLLQNSLRTLKAYVDKRKKKTKLRIKAEMLLCLQYVQLWYNQWQEKQYVASLEKQAVAFYQLSCLRYTLSTWEERYHEVVYLKELQENAAHYYTHNLVKKCFTAWKTWSDSCIQKRIVLEEVHVLHCHHVQKMYFKFWRIITLEKRSKRRKFRNAVEYYKQSLIKKVWASWKLFYRHKKLKAERVHALKVRLLTEKLRRIFAGWLLYKNEMVEIKKKMNISIQHYNLAIIIKAWDGWLYYMEYRQQKRSSKRKYLQPADQLKAVVMTSYFHNWLDQTVKLQRAKRHYHKRLMRRCLRAWHNEHLEQVALRERKQRLRLVSKAMVFMRCLKVWRFRLEQRLEVKHQETVALIFWSTKLQRKCLKRWIDYVRTQQEEIKRYMDALETQRANLLQEGFKAWMRADLVAAQERETTALEYVTQRARREFHIESKYFARWKLKVRKKKKKKKTSKSVGYSGTIPYDTDTQSLLTMGDMRRMYKTVLDAPIMRAACNVGQRQTSQDSSTDRNAYQTHSENTAPSKSVRVLDDVHLNRKRPPPRIPLFMQTKPIASDNSNNDLAVLYNITNYGPVQ